ncbi:MAG: hypothetical protein HGB26_07910 [Desulfobulbaceae bacterium]|nr:hypothetical protein [Desulfobulbaceae bacterium]
MEAEALKEMLKLNRDLAVQITAQNRIIFAMFALLSSDGKQQIKSLLQAQPGGSESLGLSGDSYRLAVDLISVAIDGGETIDMRKILHLIPGGKPQ